MQHSSVNFTLCITGKHSSKHFWLEMCFNLIKQLDQMLSDLSPIGRIPFKLLNHILSHLRGKMVQWPEKLDELVDQDAITDAQTGLCQTDKSIYERNLF